MPLSLGSLSLSPPCHLPFHGCGSCRHIQSQPPLICFLVVSSHEMWWSSLEPVLCDQWRKSFQDPLPQELRQLQEVQQFASK